MSDTQKLYLVFVVDDEPVIASSLAMILTRCGFDARFFTEPHKALLATQAEPPDLLITDVVMPVLSGVELAIRVRKTCPNCKVLLFSGQARMREFLAAARAEGHEFEVLSKPVHPSDLLQKIQSLNESAP